MALFCGTEKKTEAGGGSVCVQKSPEEIPWCRSYKGDSGILCGTGSCSAACQHWNKAQS